jgi:hypothetical protein
VRMGTAGFGLAWHGRHGRARRVGARPGVARRGEARFGMAGKAGLDQVGLGGARQGRRGEAGCDEARRETGVAWHGRRG